MLSPQALLKGLVSRMLPQTNVDSQSQDVPLRLGRYGDLKVETSWYGDALLADEGTIMVATTLPGATALYEGIQTAYVATQAAFVLVNSDPAGGKRIYPKYLSLCQSQAPASGTCLRYTIVLDNVNRTPTTLSSGTGGTGPGTAAGNTGYRAPVVCTNADLNPQIVGIPYFTLGQTGSTGSMTVPSPGPGARTIVGNRMLKPSIPVVLDQYLIQFGGGDAGGTFQAGAALAKIVEHAPALVIGPGQTMLVHLWSTSNAANSNAWDDVSLVWVEK